ncbi:MAG: amidohydrolase [Candidatus Eremiobacteraeota bacterium]|nr:amidohydrolase [Candidatus Eremiobacteraeota bacterium]
MLETTERAEHKASVAQTIDRHARALERFGDDIFRHPEIGFHEERTATAIAEALRRLDLDVEEGLALTGVRARLRAGSEGPTICVLAELDGLPVPGHPQADRRTGVAHACGHNAQLAHLLGVATAFVETDVLRHLAGEIVLLVVPAEEYVDLRRRSELAKKGKIEFLGGKPELVRLGAFDEIALAMMVHASGDPGESRLSCAWHYNGFVAKQARFIGRAAHAGNAPDRGINALNAATLAMQAIALQRETFRDEDRIRIHPIVTAGGTAVNVVPDDVRLETFVRGATLEAIDDAAQKVDRALKAGAYAVGAEVEIETLPGYLPLSVDRDLGRTFKANACALVGERHWRESPSNAASTDAGDLSHLVPVLHPSHGGCAGENHTIDFKITDPNVAYVLPAKALASTIVDLLADGAAEARRVMASFKPKLSRDDYLATMRAFTRVERA